MRTIKELRDAISKMYINEYFTPLGIEYDLNECGELCGSGLWENGNNTLRFATMPHIGDRYAKAPVKILFVGLDIGKDEMKKIQTLETRHESLCYWPSNPHMFGTYMEALYFLRPDLWKIVMEKYDNLTNQRALTELSKEFTDVANLGHYFSLTNYHKFVTVNREKRTGAENRESYNIAKETETLFMKEVEILKPDVVWFQGHKLPQGKYQELANKGYDVYVAYHPSTIGRTFYARRANYINYIVEQSTENIYRRYVSE